MYMSLLFRILMYMYIEKLILFVNLFIYLLIFQDFTSHSATPELSDSMTRC